MALAVVPAAAQMTVEVKLPQEQFLPGEPMVVAVRITNQSGQTVRLGAGPDWLHFTIETQQGAAVAQTADVPVEGPFSLESSETGTKRVNLAPYFALNEAGSYKLSATVKIKEWAREVNSQGEAFDIINGIKMWEQSFGVPLPTNAPPADPEIRRYILQQANYLRGQIRLYLRVTDASGARPIKVVSVGPLLSLSRPEHLVDSASNLHILYQNGPRTFWHHVFTPDGDLILRQTFDYVSTRPRLQVIEEGKIQVVGGARRVVKSDIPPPKPILLPDGPQPVNP